MSTNYRIKIDGNGKVLETSRPVNSKMAVNYTQTWCVYAKSLDDLLKGLSAIGTTYRFVKPTNVKQHLNLWILQWELSNRPFRPAVIGVGNIPGYGIAKRIAGLGNKTWGVLINLEDKKSTKNGTVGWTHVDSTSNLSANSQFYDCSYISKMVKEGVRQMKTGEIS